MDPIKQNYREMLQTPSAKHYFGTDRYGRDIWSRILWGGRRLLMISLLAVLVGILVASLWARCRATMEAGSMR